MVDSDDSDSQLTSEQRVTFAKTKINDVGRQINDIVRQGREALNEPTKILIFRVMVDSIRAYYKRFQLLKDELLSLVIFLGQEKTYPSTAEKNLYERIDSEYFEALALEAQFTEPANANPNTATRLNESTIADSTILRARLPKITLPRFSGKRTEWPLFRDTFKSLIHQDTNLSGMDKFHFLISSLSGTALILLKHIPLLEENYQLAWTTLSDQFENKRLLATSYLNELLELKPLGTKTTPAALNTFLSIVAENTAAFKLLAIPQASEFVLFTLIIRYLDSKSRQAFECQNTEEFPTLENLIKYLRARCQMFELVDDLKDGKVPKHIVTPFKPKLGKSRSSFFVSETPKAMPGDGSLENGEGKRCYICQANCLKIINCPKFRNWNANERFKALETWKGCRNCLMIGHRTKECRSRWKCKICSAHHHSMLHLDKSTVPADPIKAPSSPDAEQPRTDKTAKSVLSNVANTGTQVVLGTAKAYIKDSWGRDIIIRMVLDSGSHFSFITTNCADKLGLKRSKHNLAITGLGETSLPKVHGKVPCELRPIHRSDLDFQTEALMVPVITSELPTVMLPTSIWKSFLPYKLADDKFWEPGQIDFLLGSDLFPDILQGNSVTVSESHPKLLDTVFGFVVTGKFQQQTPSKAAALIVNLDQTMERFWALEEAKPTLIENPDNVKCERHFSETHYRTSTGRFVVSLPFRNPNVDLSGSRQGAVSRFLNLEAKFRKNAELKLEYQNIMKDYIESGHMTLTQEPARYLLPHHGVKKGSSESNKLRVVFDASFKTPGGSLNDHLFTGSKLHQDISDILINFRTHTFVFSADIKKMYRQILVEPSQCKFQHILWRFNFEDPIAEYQLKTLTFGLTSAPFLAMRVVRQLVLDHGHEFPAARKVLLQDIYVDDILTGASTERELVTIQSQIIELLAKACFELGRWASNSRTILKRVNSHEPKDAISLQTKDDVGTKILGLQWDIQTDSFSYGITVPSPPYSKRSMLSSIARIYDPVGYLAPTIFWAKTLIQRMWAIKANWDDPLPNEIYDEWRSFVTDLPIAALIRIPRFIGQPHIHPIELLGFSDASNKGYAATIYLRVPTREGTQMKLLKAKTRLAPLKTISIPRLELCGALLLSNLFESLNALCTNLQITKYYFFTDSTIVLGWLHTPPHLLRTFVANRITEITSKTSLGTRKKVASVENPADIASRGASPKILRNYDLWWNGPAWAKLPHDQWPQPVNDWTEVALPERKPAMQVMTTISQVEPFSHWMEKFSSYPKIIRITAYALRFGITKHHGDLLTVRELRVALRCCVRVIQNEYFLIHFPTGATSPKDKNLRRLYVFRDSHGIIRVGGRLLHSNLPEGTKHPMLLPGKAHFTKLMVDYQHRINLHAGPSLLLSILRREFWILGARELIRQRIFNCHKCFRWKAKPQVPLMANLPAIRFEEGSTFTNVGIDYAGPFHIRESLRRKPTLGKAYLCLFICLSTKAIHLEIVSAMTTEAFLATLDRFIARRGKPKTILSDRGTNFVGADRYLREMIQLIETTAEKIQNHLVQHGIQWIFNPPQSPHFGGIWEAGVKAAKKVLNIVMNDTPYTYEELSTVCTQVEAVLNSRPLCPLTSDPESCDCLTPGHFLIGRPLIAAPSDSHLLTQCPENRLSRWQLVQQRTQHFWNRWRREYLQTLQQRQKWNQDQPNIQENDLVLLFDESKRPTHWPRGRVIQVHPGLDGVVRVATVKTTKGTFLRPVAKLVVLSSF